LAATVAGALGAGSGWETTLLVGAGRGVTEPVTSCGGALWLDVSV
jgi:hypothetical protein